MHCYYKPVLHWHPMWIHYVAMSPPLLYSYFETDCVMWKNDSLSLDVGVKLYAASAQPLNSDHVNNQIRPVWKLHESTLI